MGLRRKSRELALQALYQGELTGKSFVDDFDLLCENFQANRKAIPYALELLRGISENQKAINQRITEHAKNWRLERMSVLDRNILRIAAYEMCLRDDVPPGVAINEAIELAKQYCADDSAPFINGILDAIRKAAENGKG